MGRYVRRLLTILVAATGLAAPASARDTLGVFDGWAAFRDARPLRCYAIAEPVQDRRSAPWRPFASVSTWPGLQMRGQFHIRLRKVKRPGAPVMLAIGDQRILLASGGVEAWAPDARADAAIVAAMRGGSVMSVEAVDTAGRSFVDTYRLRGAATAIDAAALGCAPLR